MPLTLEENKEKKNTDKVAHNKTWVHIASAI